MSTQFWLDLLTRAIFWKKTSQISSASQCGSCLCFNSLLLVGSWGTSVHLAVFHSDIESMGKRIIVFFCPPHPLSQFGTHMLCPCKGTLQSHCSCSDASPPPQRSWCLSCHMHSRPECVGTFCFAFFTSDFWGAVFCLRVAPHSGRGTGRQQHMCCRPMYCLLA